MSLQIAKLVLYSRKGAIREVAFRTGALNILTGAPQTGKSALIDIIDYVTGRRECNVADGVIRKFVGLVRGALSAERWSNIRGAPQS